MILNIQFKQIEIKNLKWIFVNTAIIQTNVNF